VYILFPIEPATATGFIIYNAADYKKIRAYVVEFLVVSYQLRMSLIPDWRTDK
jgi:hypothetical protein